MIRPATTADAVRIHAALAANAGDTSLFQQSLARIRRDLGDFIVAVDTDDRAIGCAALHWHTQHNAEVLAVAVDPQIQGRGTGGELMRGCLERAAAGGATAIWLATAKPAYFARFGFTVTSRWHLPPRALLRKLRLIFEQPVRRWLPALFGRHTFMTLSPPSR